MVGETQRGTPAIGDIDLHLFREGKHARLFDKLGAHVVDEGGARGVSFAVWAPNAETVSVIGDFNGWDASRTPLTSLGESGIFRGFAPGVAEGAAYKYRVVSRVAGHVGEKADPFGNRSEAPPGTASIVCDPRHAWGDDDWMASRASRTGRAAPMSIYELHLGSWMRDEPGRLPTYRDVLPRLVEYVTKLGFTHVEIMPLTEHPFYGSWGYETTGYFAATSRYGAPGDLMALVDGLHRAGVGVILDWVPAHFPTDAHGLGFFDGTHLYEHEDPRQGFHPEWKTSIFNYGRDEVRSFLLSSAFFWIERFHVDAIRVDGVASMLYLDYGRREGEWVPNRDGGKENLDAVAFLRQLNDSIADLHPEVLTVAEESTSWPRVTGATRDGGLGFGLKWDLGWMHDTLAYLGRDPVHRRHHHGALTFRSMYAASEAFVLPLSHDEVVHGKGSLLAKMSGDPEQKLSHLRLLFAWMFAQPGKKLLFMGSELAVPSEWDHDAGLDFTLAAAPERRALALLVGELNRLHREERSLHELDCDPAGFAWISADDAERSVYAFERRARDLGDRVVAVFNFTPVLRQNHRVGVPFHGVWDEILNTDALELGGGGRGNLGGVEASPIGHQGREWSLNLTLPPLGAVFMKPRSPRDPAKAGPAPT